MEHLQLRVGEIVHEEACHSRALYNLGCAAICELWEICHIGGIIQQEIVHCHKHTVLG